MINKEIKTTRKEDFFWVNTFNTNNVKFKDIYIESEKANNLKVIKNQIINFKNLILETDNIKLRLEEILFKFNFIKFDLWNYYYCKDFKNNQIKFFEEIKIKENIKTINIAKNILLKNLDIFLIMLNKEINKLEILRIEE